MSAAPRILDVAVLCSANRFRSPIAAQALRNLAAHADVAVRSYAVFGDSGRPVVPEAQAIAASNGVDVAGHVSTRLSPGALEAADLVIGFEAVHASAAVVDGGARAHSTFLLLELHQLLTGIAPGNGSGRPAERARQIIARVDELRTGDWFSPALQFAAPIEGPRRGYEPAIRRIVRVSEDVGRALFGVGGRRAAGGRRWSLA